MNIIHCGKERSTFVTKCLRRNQFGNNEMVQAGEFGAQYTMFGD